MCRACRGQNGSGLSECKHGHPFNELNTYIRPNGNRACRTCRTEAKRKYLAKKKDA